jgi:filamentous hemagglutinin family protein
VKKSERFMKKTNFGKKKIIASILCANMMLMSMPLNTLASEITGITPNGNTYNIEAAKVSGSTGFRHYDKFDLSKGDIANLIYKNDYSKFVNLVNEQIKINGLVQTLKDNSFYNGHAIFVSPNGMIVGASGVLNVGSLSILTPSQNSFNSFKTNYENGNLSSYEYGADKYKGLITDSQGNIVINGKVLAREEVNLYGSDIKIGDGTNRAGIIAGANNTKYENSDAAKSVFDSLVSNNITDTDGFALSNGKIQIVANKQSKFADAAGNINANIDIKKADLGANEINIFSKTEVDRQERIDLASAKIDVEDSTLTGDTISITAEANQKKKLDIANPVDDGQFVISILDDIFDGDAPNVTSLWGTAGKAVADVTIKNSTINALKATSSNAETPDLSVLIHAESSSDTSENANFLTPAIIDLIKNEEAHISEYFSTGTYNGFEGARSSATVTIEKSTINAKSGDAKNVEISTDASSNLDANNRVLAFMMPIGMYATGTETISKAIVKGSTLNVINGDVDVVAVSTN